MADMLIIAPEVADAAAEDDGGPVIAAGFTPSQLSEIITIATAKPGDAEETHNRWYRQRLAEGWRFGNTNAETHMSSYCRRFSELMPGQQALLIHELSLVASVSEGRQGD